MDHIRIGIIALLLVILFIGICKSMKVKKLGYFLVAILVDIIIVAGIIYYNKTHEAKGDEPTLNQAEKENNRRVCRGLNNKSFGCKIWRFSDDYTTSLRQR